jgi:hypothetical protein
MTDREPLELAAKAAGTGQLVSTAPDGYTTTWTVLRHLRWNPIADDGDACGWP